MRTALSPALSPRRGSSKLLGGGQERNPPRSIARVVLVANLLATSAAGTTAIPGSGVMLATSTNYEQYRPASALTALQPASVTNNGGSQPHTNMMPYLVLNFCICLAGYFPPRN